jgi:hypothetical protein
MTPIAQEDRTGCVPQTKTALPLAEQRRLPNGAASTLGRECQSKQKLPRVARAGHTVRGRGRASSGLQQILRPTPTRKSQSTVAPYAAKVERANTGSRRSGTWSATLQRRCRITSLAWIYTSNHSPKFLGDYGSFFPTCYPKVLNILVR